MKYFVYILFSKSHNKFYIGQTQDIKSRLNRHNQGLEKSTFPFIPCIMVCAIEKSTRSEAVLLEKKLKKLNREKLKKFISKYG